MRNGFLGSFALLLAAAGVSLGQAPAVLDPVQPPPPTTALRPLVAPGPVQAGTPVSSELLPGLGCTGGACPLDCGVPICEAPPRCPGPAGRFWLTAEYLLWWVKNDNVPPLVTTGPATFPAGFLGAPGTSVLFGGGDLNKGTFSGVRLNSGVWLDDCQTCGLMGSFLYLGQRSTNAVFSSGPAGAPGPGSTPVLARPFFNVNSGTQFSELAAFPGISTGSIVVNSPTQLWGAGLNMVKTVCCGCWYRVNLLGGFQFMSLEEAINITETAQFAPGAPVGALAGNTFIANDHFGTHNRFYGGTVGAAAWLWRGDWFVNPQVLVGIGTTHETIDIGGSQQVFSPAGASLGTFNGGLMALPSNSGHFTHDSFSVLPMMGINVGRMITRNISVFTGYTFMYWSRVVRPGDQIDTSLNINQIPNFGLAGPAAPARPIVPFKETDFWAQGINFGVGLYW